MGKILILDEYSGVRELMSAELGNEGYLVVPIGKPSLIKELMKTLEPDLLLLDLHLGGVDRWDVLEAVKKEAPLMPVLIFSAYEGYVKDARLNLADGFVMKSSCFDKLKQKVSEVLGRKLIRTAERRKKAASNPGYPFLKQNQELLHLIGEKTRRHISRSTG